MKIYDLSHPFSVADMVFPGTPKMSYQLTHSYEKDDYNLGLISVNTHAGTHTDAPRHFLKEGDTLEKVPLSSYVGPCVVVDVRHVGALEEINVEDIRAYEEVLREKKRLLLLSGWSSHVNTPAYFTDYPRISLELAHYLVDLGIVLLGVEPPSLNPPLYIEVHQTLLEGGIAIVEGLRGLEAILGKEVLLCAAPIALVGVDGFPLRAYAIEGVDKL